MSSSTPSSAAPAGTAPRPRPQRRTAPALTPAGTGTGVPGPAAGAHGGAARREALRSYVTRDVALHYVFRGLGGWDPGRAVVGGWDRRIGGCGG
jgi:hypothetical protein